MKHIISALVENKPGVLAHVAGMFAARGFNIDSLVVGRTEDPNLSRMTIVVIGDDRVVEQVRKQLARIIPVVKVQDFAAKPVVARDLMLVSIAVPPEKRPEVFALIEMFRGHVVDISSKDGDGRGQRPGDEDRGLHRRLPALRHQERRPHRHDRHAPPRHQRRRLTE